MASSAVNLLLINEESFILAKGSISIGFRFSASIFSFNAWSAASVNHACLGLNGFFVVEFEFGRLTDLLATGFDAVFTDTVGSAVVTVSAIISFERPFSKI